VYLKSLVFLSLSLIAFFCATPATIPTRDGAKEVVDEFGQPFLVVDTHIDLPYRLQEKMEDISVRTEGGDFDYPRAKAGGLNIPFMSIYVPASYEDSGGGKELAERLIHMVEKFAVDFPDKFAVVHSVPDARRQVERGLIALAMGIENGTALEGKLQNIEYFYNRGIRYITLTHSKNNLICDSSFDTERKWNGLSPFGMQVVQEMNRLGIMIDVSHVSDSTFFQVIRMSKAPVIASHSSCRHYTPGWERNMSDEMILELAKNGGVLQINFGSAFLRPEFQQELDKTRAALSKYYEEHNLQPTDSLAVLYAKEYHEQHPTGYASIDDVVAHIDHVVQLVGAEFVGIGSDYDGVGDSLPTGLKDVSSYPNLILKLRDKGYSDEDIRKICGENLLRVWTRVAQVARSIQAQ
jgi:membrane dipeptidase